VEIRVLRAATFKVIVKFLWEDIICRYRIFGRFIINRGLENKDLVVQFVVDYGIKRVVILPYNVKVNGMIERDHKSIINVLAKMIKDDIDKWIRNLYTVL
jgi:hypothetical protein